MATRLPTGARWPRSLLALFFASSAGALGLGALAAGTAQAANDGTCGQLVCKPTADTVQVAPAGTGGERATIVWTQTTGVFDSGNTYLAITWSPPTTIPTGAPQPPVVSDTVKGTCVASGPSKFTCAYDWPADLMVNGYVLNGTYGVVGTANDCAIGVIGCNSGNISGTTAVVNPPTPPTNVKATVDTTSATVKVSFTPSPEPDLAGYRVFRNDGSQACQVSNYPPPPAGDISCVDSTSGGGKFSYHVVAVRWGANYDPASEKSSASSAPSAPVTVAGPPATTTTVRTGTTLPPLGPPGFIPKPTPGRLGAGIGAGGVFHSTPGTRPALSGDNPANASDPGFQPLLPYGQASTTIAGDPTALSAPPVAPHKGKTSVGTIAVIGAGLLVAVIALHGLWLRAEVRRPTPLEALDPEA